MTRRKTRCGEAAAGFTLVEIAIVIFILGILRAGLIGPVEVQMEARDRRATMDLMEDALDALYGYALTNGALPCPDDDGNGTPDPPFDPSDPTTADCDVGTNNGFLPWAELGVARGDAWGNRFTYRVRHREFTLPAQDGSCNGNTADEFDLCSTGNITITTRGDDSSTSGTVEGKFAFPAVTQTNVAAVIVSHGRNGFGATSVDGVARPAVPAANDDEDANADDDENFVSRNYSREQNGCADDNDESTPLCEFDDIVMPVSRTILNSRMVAAGQLP
ncbi:MAG: type II secretion system protein [Gammaproteobacteria bacterium]|nr:type II secretion system protein [Gammaproteobacteria bacterium]